MMVINCNNIQELDGYTNGVNVLQFATDADGNKIVGLSVLTDDAFIEIREVLSQQPQIPYNPPQTDI